MPSSWRNMSNSQTSADWSKEPASEDTAPSKPLNSRQGSMQVAIQPSPRTHRASGHSVDRTLEAKEPREGTRFAELARDTGDDRRPFIGNRRQISKGTVSSPQQQQQHQQQHQCSRLHITDRTVLKIPPNVRPRRRRDHLMSRR